MLRVDEQSSRPILKQGMFSRIDTQKREISFNTPNKKAKEGEENKENNRNKANRNNQDKKMSPNTRKSSFHEPSPKPERSRHDQIDDKPAFTELRELLEKEKKNGLEYKKRFNNEKVIVNNLKSKIRQLEDEKSKQEELHRKSLINIEQKVATLKNTNLQLLNKAHKFEGFNKELEDMRQYKESIRSNLKTSYEFIMSLLRGTFAQTSSKSSQTSDKNVRKKVQKSIISFFQNESENIMDLGMQNVFQSVMLVNQDIRRAHRIPKSSGSN